LLRGLLAVCFGHAFSEFHDKLYYFILGFLVSDWLIRRSRTRNAAVFDALVMQFSICMTKRATQPDHSLLARSFQPE
jgi:glucose dehydrogenase